MTMPATRPYDWSVHASPAALAEALADRVAAALGEAIATRGAAALAVSGGTTPVRFFGELAGHEIDWTRVVVTLVDERFVPPSSPRSNERLVRENLLNGKAARAHLVALYADAPNPEAAAEAASETLRALPLPFDVVVLGMGTDGHTASFFPDADGLETLLDPDGESLVLPVHAKSAGEPRLTLSLPAIANARMLVVHIEGEAKRHAFEAAFGDEARPPKPIRTVLESSLARASIFWAPSEGTKP